MLNKPTLLIMAAFLITISLVVISVFPHRKWEGKLASPFSGAPSPIPTPIPSPTPKTFNFDSSTDLKGELETVNPQVLDSDFE